MSRPVDEKIVKMSLDNNDFKSKVTQTIGFFGKLVTGMSKVKDVDLSKSSKDISNINSAVGKTDMNKLVEGVQNVSSKFTALGVIAITALQNITNRAVDAGINLAKSFSLQPLTDGFGEYENKMKSVQVIMSNTMGKSSMEEIAAALDDLNVYADKTIYSFADMTQNIGTFTAAGVGLKDSATAIKGISNLAAASGSNTQQASTAMYQLSQALATGKVGLQDWNSVVNAGMGGKMFQEGLQNTAKNLGKNVDGAKSFRDSLADGWLTTDVLLQTLSEFSENESMLDAATKVRTFTQLVDTAREALGSGWATTWELIFGNFEEAGTLWTNAGNAILGPIDASSKARNKLLEDFVTLGGRATLVNSVSNAFKALQQIIGVVISAFRDVFPPTTAQNLMNIAKGVESFTAKLTMSEATAAKVKTIFTGLFSILSIGVQTVKMVANALVALIPDNIGGDILALLAKIASLITGFDKSMKATDKTKGKFVELHSVVNKMAEAFRKFASVIGGVLTGAGNIISKMASVLRPVVSSILKGIGAVVKSFNTQDILNGGFIVALILAVNKFKKIGSGFEGIIDKVTGLMDGFEDAMGIFGKLGDALSAMTTSIKVGTLLKIAGAVAVLALSIKLLATIPAKDISKSLLAITAVMVLLTKALGAIAGTKMGIRSAITATTVLPALAASIVIMAGAMKIMASMSPEELGRGLLGLAATVTILVTALNVMGKNSGKIATSSLSLLALSTSVVILSSAVKKLSEIKATSLAKSVGALGAILLELAIFLKVVDGAKLSIGSGLAVMAIAGAITIMVSAIQTISNIPVDMLQKGLITIGIILGEIAIFAKIASGSKIVNAATGMVIIAGAIKMLIPPIQELGNMSVKQLVKGLGSLAVVLGEVVIAMKLASGGVAGAIAITVVAGAINMLVPPLQALSKMSVKEIAKSLITLAGALGIIALAANLIGPLGSVALLALAAAITAIGIAALGIGIGITAFTTALTIMANMTAQNIETIMKSLKGIITGLNDLIPSVIVLITNFVLQMAAAFIIMLPALTTAIGELILGILIAMATYVPKFMKAGTDLIVGIMEAFGTETPRLIDAGVKMIVDLTNGMANGIRENQQSIVDAVLNTVEAILEVVVTALVSVVDILFGWIPGVSDKTKEMGDSATTALRDAFNIKDVADKNSNEFVGNIEAKKSIANTAGANLGGAAKDGAGSIELGTTGAALGGGLTTGLDGVLDKANSSGEGLGGAAKTGAGSVSLDSTGSLLGTGFNTGVGGAAEGAKTKGEGLGKSAKTGVESISLESSGKNAGEGFATGVDSKQGRVSSAAEKLGSMAKGALEAVLKIFSPSRVMRASGGYFGEGFALGIGDEGSNVASKAAKMAEGAVTAVQGYASSFADAMQDNLDFAPVITPVLDMSNVTRANMPNQFDVRGMNGYNGGMQGAGNSYVFNITGSKQDADALADIIEKKIVRRIQS